MRSLKLSALALSLFITVPQEGFAQKGAKPATAPTPVTSPPASSPGPKFLDDTGRLAFQGWSGAVSFQTFAANPSKGMAIEAMTPSFIYGRASVRLNISRNHVQAFNKDTLAANPASGVEYLNFNIISLNLIVPMGSSIEGLTPYFGGGVGFVLPENALSSSTQPNVGLVAGLNLRLHHPSAGATKWALFGEFGYSTENVEADKAVGNPQIADGMLLRGGARYFF